MDMNFLSPPSTVKEQKDPGESAMKGSLAKGTPHGFEVGYGSFTINGRMLGSGEPIRVKQGERVLFHVLNGSATEIRSLALPGHTFTVVAMDGNPIPRPVNVPGLWLGGRASLRNCRDEPPWHLDHGRYGERRPGARHGDCG